MESSSECVEIDVTHSSQRFIHADGEEIKISIKCDDAIGSNTNGIVKNKKQVRIVEEGSVSYEVPKQRSPDSKEGKVCSFYKKFGKCKFENECHFLHENPIEKNVKGGIKNSPDKMNGSKSNEKDIANHATSPTSEKHMYTKEVNGDSSYLNINSTNTKTCKFFIQKKGCRYGDSCPFMHYRSVGDAGAEEAQDLPRKLRNMSIGETQAGTKQQQSIYSEETKTKSKKKSSRKCMFLMKDGFCKKGDQCGFNHVLKGEEKQIDEAPPTYTEIKDANDVLTHLKDNESINNPKIQKKCIYFKRSGCWLKDTCPFIHDSSEVSRANQGNINTKKENTFIEKRSNEEADEKKGSQMRTEYNKERENSVHKRFDDSLNEPLKKSNQYCSFFLTPKGCFRGENCVYLHPLGDNEVNSSENYLSLQATEYKQLEKRFAVDDKFRLVQSQPSTIYSVIFEPSDPDWGIVVKEFVLRVEFPAEYPRKLFNITLEDNEIYPEGFTCFMNEGIQSWIEERQQDRGDQDLAFRPFLKWFDRNVEGLVLDAGRKVKQLRDAQEAGITLIPHDTILQNMSQDEGVGSHDDSKSDAEESYNNMNEIYEEENNIDVNGMMTQNDTGKIANGNPVKLSAKVKIGTELKFSHLEMNENVASLILKNLLLVVQCIRCKGRTELNLQSKKKVNASCKKCHVSHSATFHPEIVHQYSHIAGYIHLDGCKAFDAVLVDSTLIINCLNCSKDTIKKGIAYGKKGDYWCSSCHTKMEIQIMASKFTQLQKNGEKLQEVKTVAKKAVKHPGIKEGSPLPDQGTCKHYKKSYRWLRFPCCGKVYPCDICHEEGEENDHEMKFATRMICGHCSKEQPFAKDKPCVSCKSNVTKSKSSHWEGGKGCRNRATMDRNENRKTAGMGKTISRKKAAET